MSNVVIGGTASGATALPTLGVAIDRTQDLIPLYSNSAAGTYSATPNTILGITGAPVGTSDSQTLTNKILTAPTISSPVLSGTITGTYTIGGTPTFPSSVVTLTGSQTLTNKVLTSPTINTPSITNATISADSVTGYSASTTGTIYGISVTTAKISGSVISNTTLPYTALSTDSSWALSTFAPAAAGYTGAVTVNVATYIQIGKLCFVNVDFTGTSNATTLTFTLPIAPKNSPQFQMIATDSGTVQTSPGLITTTASSTTASCFKTLASGAFTSSGTKAIKAYGLVYEVS